MRALWKQTLCLAMAAIFIWAGTGWSQGAKYPAKPIDLIVPWAPGGGTDVSARVLAGYATKKFGYPVNVVNVTGASGITGMMQVMKARPDGYSLLMDGNVTASFLFAARTDLPMKIEDRTYIARATTDWCYFVTNIDTGWKTLDDLYKLLKTRPENFRWGAGAYASAPMFSQVDLFLAGGVDMEKIKKTKMVIFEKGNAVSLQACVTGDVQFGMAQAAELMSLLGTNRIRALVVNAPERTKEFPDIPTAKELGYPDAKMAVWYGVSGPKGLPDAVVRRWDELMKGAMTDPEAQAAAAKVKKAFAYIGGTEFKNYVLQEYQRTIPIAAGLGLRK